MSDRKSQNLSNTNSKREIKYIGASLALHIFAFLIFIYRDELNLISKKEPLKELVEISFVELPKDAKSRQIVDTDLVEKTDTPDSKAFLGQQTQRVRKQTRAEKTGAYVSAPTQSRSAKQSDQIAKNTDGLTLKKLGMKPNLAPLGHLAPGSASSDYVRNAEQGAQTLLNTREYVYYSYYQRVRQQLEQFWEPNLRSRLKKFFAKGRTLASDKEHSTRLMVHLDKEGTITKIEVRDTSGLLELDQAAIDAFNKAGPFPNPPRGMLEANNGAVTVEWEFVLRT